MFRFGAEVGKGPQDVRLLENGTVNWRIWWSCKGRPLLLSDCALGLFTLIPILWSYYFLLADSTFANPSRAAVWGGVAAADGWGACRTRSGSLDAVVAAGPTEPTRPRSSSTERWCARSRYVHVEAYTDLLFWLGCSLLVIPHQSPRPHTRVPTHPHAVYTRGSQL